MIRFATLDDIPALAALGQEFFRLHPFAAWTTCDADSLAHTLAALLDQPAACVLVAEVETECVGVLLGGITPLYFNYAVRIAYESAWFLTESARRAGHAGALFAAFEHWARTQQVQAIVFTSLSTGPDIADFYARRGYRPYETNHVKRV